MILLVEDEKPIMNVLSSIIAEEFPNYTLHQATDGEMALKMIQENPYKLVICDIKMPKYDGIQVLESTMKHKPELPFIMVSGHGDIDLAVSAIKMGAFDYIPKPPDLNRLLLSVNNALSRENLIQENKELKNENKTLKKILKKEHQMIGVSKPIVHIKNMIEKVAKTEARVLVTGQNGSGKELVAHSIHQLSDRNGEPLVEVNCAAIPSELIESELFGHTKGSFTGAHKDKKGKFEQANGGTLFLDEIGDMSLSAQAKVLRALQEGKISRVGDDKEIAIDVRVIAATNKNLKEEISQGNFREDLYHRLAVILLEVPPLRERKEDIPLLIEYFCDKISVEQNMLRKKFHPDAIVELQNHPFTGNIRELRNIVERLMILGGEEISKKDVVCFVKV
ncbi:MAG: response regulator [Flavobacteriaceae bacterium]|nr:MAG: response regulator [Flavobacteriaceae bacterium]